MAVVVVMLMMVVVMILIIVTMITVVVVVMMMMPITITSEVSSPGCLSDICRHPSICGTALQPDVHRVRRRRCGQATL